MRLSEAHELQLVFENNFNDANEIKLFQTIIDKIYKESKKAGVKKMFDKDESQLIRVLYEQFNPKQTD